MHALTVKHTLRAILVTLVLSPLALAGCASETDADEEDAQEESVGQSEDALTNTCKGKKKDTCEATAVVADPTTYKCFNAGFGGRPKKGWYSDATTKGGKCKWSGLFGCQLKTETKVVQTYCSNGSVSVCNQSTGKCQ